MSRVVNGFRARVRDGAEGTLTRTDPQVRNVHGFDLRGGSDRPAYVWPGAVAAGFDDPTAPEPQLAMFVSTPPDRHISTGPAAIFWDPAITARGDYRAKPEVFLFDPEGRQEAVGIFFSGADLEGRGADTFVATDSTARWGFA